MLCAYVFISIPAHLFHYHFHANHQLHPDECADRTQSCATSLLIVIFDLILLFASVSYIIVAQGGDAMRAQTLHRIQTLS